MEREETRRILGALRPFIYKMCGGAIALDEIEKGLKVINKKPYSDTTVIYT